MDRFKSIPQTRYLLVYNNTTTLRHPKPQREQKETDRDDVATKEVVLERPDAFFEILSLIDQCCVGVRRVKLMARCHSSICKFVYINANLLTSCDSTVQCGNQDGMVVLEILSRLSENING